jgi:hypothetical protein
MKRATKVKLAVLTVAMLMNQTLFAAETEEEPKICKLPKAHDFSLQEYSQPERLEVAPESEYSFRLTRAADPNKIKVMAKDKILKVEIVPNSSFILVKGKLTPEMTGKFVRLEVFVGTELGCHAQDGWLVKVKG